VIRLTKADGIEEVNDDDKSFHLFKIDELFGGFGLSFQEVIFSTLHKTSFSIIIAASSDYKVDSRVQDLFMISSPVLWVTSGGGMNSLLPQFMLHKTFSNVLIEVI
jgi:hypothetical protein